MKAEIEYTEDLFMPISKEEKNAEKIHRPSIKYWDDVWRRLKMNKLAMSGLIIIVLFIIMAIIGTHINGFKYFQQDLNLS